MLLDVTRRYPVEAVDADKFGTASQLYRFPIPLDMAPEAGVGVTGRGRESRRGVSADRRADRFFV
jgi:hypothetical protein